VPTPDADLRTQRRVVDAFLAAVRDGDFEALVTVLDPAIVLRGDGGALKGVSRLVRGAQAVVAQAATFSNLASSSQVVLVNGNIGVLARRSDGHLVAVIGFTIAGGKVVEIDILADPDRLGRLDLSAIER
jgi:ketosteroid isomerase-like protein